jgi:flavorubredoxin
MFIIHCCKGCLPEMIELCKPDVVFASKIGYKTLQEHFDFPADFTKNHLKFVQSGETLEFNNDKIKFIETKGLHWPDSMVSYLEGEKILFSNVCTRIFHLLTLTGLFWNAFGNR